MTHSRNAGLRTSNEILIAGADARRADGVDQKRSEKTPRNRAVGQRSNAQPPRKQHTTRNDGGVVEQRREGGEQEQPPREQHGGNHSTHIKEQLRRQQNAGQVDAKLHLLRIELGEEKARNLGRKDFRQDNPDSQHGGHHGDDDRESLLRLAFLFLREKAGVDRNEGDGSSSAGHQVVQPVGNCEAGDVGVGRRSGAERVGNVGLAHVADHPREHDRRHEQQGGGKSAVLVRRTKPAQQTCEPRDRSRFGAEFAIFTIKGRFYTQTLRCPDTPNGSCDLSS